MINKLLIIIRGIPGSGKSTLAEHLVYSIGVERQHPAIFEADNYFKNVNGNYVFNPAEIPKAHAWCKQQTEHAMFKEIETIIVSNTSCAEWEYRPYIEMARLFGYKVQVIDVHGEFKNIHDVPKEALERMEKKWVPFNRSLLKRENGDCQLGC